MKAGEFLDRYSKGERNFQRVDLQRQSLKGQDLSNADFSHANIRGSDFSGANLQNAVFVGAEAGLTSLQTISLIILLIFLILLSSVGAVLIGNAIGSTCWNYQIPAYVLVTTSLFSLLVIANYRGLKAAIWFGAITGILGYAIGLIATSTLPMSNPCAGLGWLAYAVAWAVAGGGGWIVITSVAIATVKIIVERIWQLVVLGGVTIFAWSFGIFQLVSISLEGTWSNLSSRYSYSEAVSLWNQAANIYWSWSWFMAIAIIVSAIYVSWKTITHDERFELVWKISVAFSSIGGTSFRKANLTNANFTSAVLKNTDFRESALTHILWRDAKKLDCARVGDSIIADRRVRELLVCGKGYKRSYIAANFEGANLSGVDLSEANLTRSNLSSAILRDANLKESNLRECLATGTVFSSAYLTGACLEAWNIDSTTELSDVDCQYIFLLEKTNDLGDRERRPHNPSKISTCKFFVD
jgi:uncharacterized protein YjbI with pentapeptide repeats